MDPSAGLFKCENSLWTQSYGLLSSVRVIWVDLCSPIVFTDFKGVIYDQLLHKTLSRFKRKLESLQTTSKPAPILKFKRKLELLQTTRKPSPVRKSRRKLESLPTTSKPSPVPKLSQWWYKKGRIVAIVEGEAYDGLGLRGGLLGVQTQSHIGRIIISKLTYKLGGLLLPSSIGFGMELQLGLYVRLGEMLDLRYLTRFKACMLCLISILLLNFD
ncbi:hypothetical protein Tco_1398877 [Tanacetum coccineum]